MTAFKISGGITGQYGDTPVHVTLHAIEIDADDEVGALATMLADITDLHEFDKAEWCNEPQVEAPDRTEE